MKKFILLGSVASTLILAGCAAGVVSSGPGRAEALLNPTKGNTVSGTVVFSEAGNKLRVVAEISGLSPGPHGSTFMKRVIAVRRMVPVPAGITTRQASRTAIRNMPITMPAICRNWWPMPRAWPNWWAILMRSI